MSYRHNVGRAAGGQRMLLPRKQRSGMRHARLSSRSLRILGRAGAYLLLFSTRDWGTEVNDDERRDCRREVASRRAEQFQQPWKLRQSCIEIAAFCCLASLCRNDEEIA